MHIPPNRTFSGKYPFRIGCTSYVYPDDIVPNVEAMGPIVDDIEVVLFESGEHSNMPNAQVIERLGTLALQHDLSYTIHFPIDKKAGARDISERYCFVEQIRRIVEVCEPLHPFGYILHLEGVDFMSRQADIMTWRTAANEVCYHVAAIDGLDPARVCVENLGYPAEWHLEIVERYGFSLCCDIGHLWANAIDNWAQLCAFYLPRARVVHLHGVHNFRDHLSLAKTDRRSLEECIAQFEAYRGVVTLELFSASDTFESLNIMSEIWDKSHS